LPSAALVALIAVASLLGVAPTKVEHWTAVHITERSTGTCSTGSLVDARVDAWRCRSGDAVHDPCFSTGAFAICPDGTPDSRDALQLRLTQPLPHAKANHAGDLTRTTPWVIVTAAGDYCYRLPTPGAVLAGKPTSYQCAGAALLAGLPNESRPVWTISLLPTGAAKRYAITAIKSAWW
jgi:hypothetical protein